MARKSGIKIKKSHQGRLRSKSKSAKKGKNISASELKRLKNSKSAKTRKQATFALNARKWKKGGKKK